MTSALLPGDRAELHVGPVTTGDLVRYAGASGDFNPIHYDHHAARDAGLDGVIAHGLYVMAVAGRVFDGWLRAAPLSQGGQDGWISAFDARFTASVRPGDRLLFTATVLDISAGTGSTVTVLTDLTGHVGDRLVLAATATLTMTAPS